MNGVVMLALHCIQNLAPEKQLPFIRLVVAIGIGEQKDSVRSGDDGLIAQHANPMHPIDVGVLIEYFGFVDPAITVAVLQDQYAVAFLAGLLSIIKSLRYPDAAAMVDVYASRVGQLLRRSEGLNGQTRRHDQLALEVLG